MWTIFKVFIEFVTILLLGVFFFFNVLIFFGCESTMWDGIKPTPPALEGKVLTTGSPGKYL